MLALVMAAHATDALPGLVNPSAVPLEPHTTQIELDGVFAYALGTTGAGATAQTTHALSDRLRVGAALGAGYVDLHPEGEVVLDGAVNVGFTAIDRPNLKVMPYVALGTYAQLGVAVWWRLGDHVAIDASGGPALNTRELSPWQRTTWKLLDEPPPNFVVHNVSFAPEVGFTFLLDDRGRHQIRVGAVSLSPLATYRLTLGAVSLEAGLNPSPLGVSGSAGVGVQF